MSHKSMSGTWKSEIAPGESRTYWLSFTDAERPKGQQFLGVCIVDVSADEAEEGVIDLFFKFPGAAPGAEWIAAAVTKAHREGCNPGGSVASVQIDPNDAPAGSTLIRNRLMQREELVALGLLEGA